MVESVAIILSILLAFAIDAGRETIKERSQEKAFLVSLLNDFKETRSRIDESTDAHMKFIDIGRTGNNITILYRVFLDNPARSEKKETIEHNLESSNIFKQKYAILEVLDATDQSIEYKVLNSFIKKELSKHVDE